MNNKFIKYRNFLFNSLCSCWLHSSRLQKSQGKLFFSTMFPTTAALKYIKEAQDIFKFYHYILIPNKMLLPVTDICDAICWMNKWHVYLRAIILLLHSVNLYSLLSPKDIYYQDYFFPHCIKEVSGFEIPTDTAEFADIWDGDWLIFCFCFPVLLLASNETLPQDVLQKCHLPPPHHFCHWPLSTLTDSALNWFYSMNGTHILLGPGYGS